MEYLLTAYPTLFLVLTVNVGLMVFIIFKTMSATIHKDSKRMIYIFAATAPLLGFILYLIKSYRYSKATQ